MPIGGGWSSRGGCSCAIWGGKLQEEGFGVGFQLVEPPQVGVWWVGGQRGAVRGSGVRLQVGSACVGRKTNEDKDNENDSNGISMCQ
jgi:hypothetical protein